jgi:hypothetical protein
MRRLLLASLLALAVSPAAAPAATGNDPSSGAFLVDGRPAFPIGLSDPPPLGARAPSGGDALALLARSGVSVIRVGAHNANWTDATLASVQAWDRAAATVGVRTWVNLRELARAEPGTSGDSMLRRVVTTLRGDAGLGFWKGADEPWWNHWAPSVLQYGYCETTGRGGPAWCQGAAPLDGAHSWITVEAPRGTAPDLAPYSPVTDSHGVDDYPVTLKAPDPDLHQVGLWTSTLASITSNHAVWGTVQICASGSYDGTGRFVLPTATQERFMVYDAIVNGARALGFFGGDVAGCWTSADAAAGWNWTFWNGVLSGLVDEIGPHSALNAALVHPDPASDYSLRSSDPQTELLISW